MENDNANQGAAAPQMRLVIDRARWLRGEGADPSRLLRSSDGRMCCLGFLGLACGVSPEQMSDRDTPWGSRLETGARWPDWLFGDGGHVDDVHVLFLANDSCLLTEAEREQKIAAAFAQHGVKVEFVGDAAPATPKEP